MTKIDPTGPVPPYRQIAAIIRARIESGVYPKGSRIPTESEIVETFEVARTTARRSIALLREQGIIETVPQRGSYVRLPADGIPLVIASGSHDWVPSCCPAGGGW